MADNVGLMTVSGVYTEWYGKLTKHANSDEQLLMKEVRGERDGWVEEGYGSSNKHPLQ